MTIFFTSDTHFGHANILKFVGRDGVRIRKEFQSLEEMHECIIERWNSVVRPQDHVWHLGDVTFRYDASFNDIMSRLQGHKRLVIGNHDKLKNPNLFRWFDKVELWRGFKEGNFTCSHIPLRLDSIRDGAYNVHGHIHRNLMLNPFYINVCVEQTNYTPISYEEILEKIEKGNMRR